MPLEIRDGLKTLTLSGTPEEMGAAHGIALRDDTHALIERFLRRGAELFDVPFEVLCRRGVECAPFVPERYLREMRGIAEGCGVSFEIILAMNCLVDVDMAHGAGVAHCCNFVAGGAATRDGVLMHGRNLDFPHGGVLPELAVVMIRHPSDGNGHPTAAIAWPGYVGFLTGYSAAQISVGEVGTPVSNPTLEGVPLFLLLREVLENCSTLDECREHIMARPRTCGYNLAFCSGRENSACALECTPSLVGYRRMRKDWLVVDGVPLTARAARDRHIIPADGFRHARMTHLVSGHAGYIDIATGLAFLRDRYDPAWGKANGRGFNCICNEFTVHSVLFLPAEERMFVAQGEIPAPLGTYHELDMRALGVTR